MTGYTYDSDMITEALTEAKQRGVPIVETFFDRNHSQFGTTGEMMERLATLHRGAVEVYLTKGAGAGGIQHSKTLFVDGYLLIGSTNWTSNSRSNHEMNCVIRLSKEGEEAHEERLADTGLQ